MNHNEQASDAIIEEFWQMCLRGVPYAAQITLRLGRAFVVFFAAYGLMRAQPYHAEGHIPVAMAIALLSLSNITKWLSAAGLAFLLIITLVPKSALVMLSGIASPW